MDPRRTAVISGGSRGIGLQFARTLLAEGLNVAITAQRDKAALAKTVDTLSAEFGDGRISGIVGDAASPADARKVSEQVMAAFGRADVLINNAGRGPREISENFTTDPISFWQIPDAAWERIVSTNVNGPFLLAKTFAPSMIENGWGRIINVSTSPYMMARKGYAPYGPSKAALDAMTRIFAQELEGTGVTVNTIAPGGPTDTDFIPGQGDKRAGGASKLLPPDIMNDALVWLISEAADGVTAARIVGARWRSQAEANAAREDTGEIPRIL